MILINVEKLVISVTTSGMQDTVELAAHDLHVVTKQTA